jgi:streptomycin 6-kinase
VIGRAIEYLNAREAKLDPSGYVLVHGDVHNNNALQSLFDPSQFKLIDPDGIFYEPGYDLGVLMREWPEEYTPNPLEKGRERSRLLSELTGVAEAEIWAWGYLQMTATALILHQIGQIDLAETMLRIAEAWT